MSHDHGGMQGLSMSSPVVAAITGAGVLASYAVEAIRSIVGHDLTGRFGALVAESVPPWWAPIALSACVPLVTACIRLCDQRAKIRSLLREARAAAAERERLEGIVARYTDAVESGAETPGETDEWPERDTQG